MNSTCEKHTTPLEHLIEKLEKEVFPRMLATAQDTLARLSLAEASERKIDTLEEPLKELKGNADKAHKSEQAQNQQMFKKLNDSVNTNMGALRKYVNGLMENASETQKPVEEEQTHFNPYEAETKTPPLLQPLGESRLLSRNLQTYRDQR